MEPASDPVVREEPPSSSRPPLSERTPVESVYGFPVAANKYEALQSAEAQSPGPREEGLVDPRTTRHLRQAATQAGNRDMLESKGNSFTVHLENPAQEICTSGTSVEPVAVGITSQFIPYSLSASSSDVLTFQTDNLVYCSLGNGAIVDGETLYGEFNCNKRISNAGPDWSGGRPGHTPFRRTFACEKLVEDSCAG